MMRNIRNIKDTLSVVEYILDHDALRKMTETILAAGTILCGGLWYTVHTHESKPEIIENEEEKINEKY